MSRLLHNILRSVVLYRKRTVLAAAPAVSCVTKQPSAYTACAYTSSDSVTDVVVGNSLGLERG